MHNIKKTYIVCYPGGAGGSFIAAALNSALFGSNFVVSDCGNCHQNCFGRMPNFFHGDSIESFEKEIDCIKKIDFTQSFIWAGHYRNLVAIRDVIGQKLGYLSADNTTFIKVSVEPSDNEINFLTSMLRRKVNACFPQMSDQEFLEQTRHYVKSWYWIENNYTSTKTTTLLLRDVFTPNLECRLEHLLDHAQINTFKQKHQEYCCVQKKLYPDLMRLLYDSF